MAHFTKNPPPQPPPPTYTFELHAEEAEFIATVLKHLSLQTLTEEGLRRHLIINTAMDSVGLKGSVTLNAGISCFGDDRKLLLVKTKT